MHDLLGLEPAENYPNMSDYNNLGKNQETLSDGMVTKLYTPFGSWQ